MPLIKYEAKRLTNTTLEMIDNANTIITEYLRQGFQLTLRQLYYQFVARDLLRNNINNYKALGSAVSAGRRAGLIDWDAITDRTRNLQSLSHWDDPADVIRSAANGYGEDLWADQPERVEVWVEKDALAGVVERACDPLDVAFFACRGYPSDSETWAAAQRLRRYTRRRQAVTIIHLGDHDPSGIDMTRDIQNRLALFGAVADIHRIALNMDQVEEYEPPPNPAKVTDTRFEKYNQEFGNESWELDALNPTILVDLITREIDAHLDRGRFDAAKEAQEDNRARLLTVSEHWDQLVTYAEHLDHGGDEFTAD